MNFLKYPLLSLFVLLASSTPALAQSTAIPTPLEQQKDSAFALLFRSLWIDLAYRYHSKDTSFILTEEEKNFYYAFEEMRDSSGIDTFIIPIPKYAEKATRYFETKTNLKRPRTDTFLSLPYLTANLIRSWEKWYKKHQSSINYFTFMEDLKKG